MKCIVISARFKNLIDSVRWADKQSLQLARSKAQVYAMPYSGNWYVVRSISDRDRTEKRFSLSHGMCRKVSLIEYIADMERRHPSISEKGKLPWIMDVKTDIYKIL